MEKQTNIPTLRFPEFKGEWEKKKLGEVAEVTAGGTPSTLKKDYWNGNIRWMNSGELNLKKVYEVENRITDVGLKNSSTKVLPKYCIMIGLAGQGKTRGTVAMNMVELCTNQSIGSILPNDSYIPDYLYQDLDNRYDELRGLSTGDGGRGGLNLSIIKSLSISFPTLAEQTKIAEFFTAIDAKIQALKTKKEKLQQYKKGVMQQLFSQMLRFKPVPNETSGDENGKAFPKWEMKKLGEVLDYEQPTNYLVSSTEYEDKYETPVVTAGKTFILGYTDETHGIFKENLPVIIFDDFTTATQFIDFPFKAKSSAMKILKTKKNTNIKFIYEAMQMIDYETGGHGRHWISVFAEMEISIPSLPEQTKIANFLSSIDEKINRTETQIQQTQAYKKGLLQNMFI